MYCATIDCGTTNSRVYIVDENARLLAKASRKVGVRDTAIQGTNETLRNGLWETYQEALRCASLDEGDLSFILSSGMITSELGLCEIPHLWAPCGVDELAHEMKKVTDPGVFPSRAPVHFVRGIKNHYLPESTGIDNVWKLDFMRGEETQIAGLLSTHLLKPPATVVILSSHTKYVPLDAQSRILGSVTTLSGQLYEAIVKETFIGKSVREDETVPDDDYYDPNIVKTASELLASAGLLRCLMFPRFLDTLLNTQWYQRRLFTEALLAADDMGPLSQVREMSPGSQSSFVLVGSARRCRIYEQLFKARLGSSTSIVSVSNDEDIDQLSIRGVLHLARLGGILRI